MGAEGVEAGIDVQPDEPDIVLLCGLLEAGKGLFRIAERCVDDAAGVGRDVSAKRYFVELAQNFVRFVRVLPAVAKA